MKLSSVQTVTTVAAQAAQTVQADTIGIQYDESDGNYVKANLTFSNSTVAGNPFAGGRKTITLWDSTTTPTYASVGDWTEAAAQARVLSILGLTA